MYNRATEKKNEKKPFKIINDQNNPTLVNIIQEVFPNFKWTYVYNDYENINLTGKQIELNQSAEPQNISNQAVEKDAIDELTDLFRTNGVPVNNIKIINDRTAISANKLHEGIVSNLVLSLQKQLLLQTNLEATLERLMNEKYLGGGWKYGRGILWNTKPIAATKDNIIDSIADFFILNNIEQENIQTTRERDRIRVTKLNYQLIINLTNNLETIDVVNLDELAFSAAASNVVNNCNDSSDFINQMFEGNAAILNNNNISPTLDNNNVSTTLNVPSIFNNIPTVNNNVPKIDINGNINHNINSNLNNCNSNLSNGNLINNHSLFNQYKTIVPIISIEADLLIKFINQEYQDLNLKWIFYPDSYRLVSETPIKLSECDGFYEFLIKNEFKKENIHFFTNTEQTGAVVRIDKINENQLLIPYLIKHCKF